MNRQVKFMWVVLGLLLASVFANIWTGNKERKLIAMELKSEQGIK